MKGALNRLRERQQVRAVSTFCNSMDVYQQTLHQLTEASGDGKSYRQENRKLINRLKPNEVYAIKCPDNDDYYRTVMIKAISMTGKFQTLISNPVYGLIPDQLDEVDPAQLFRQMKELNSSMTLTSLQAFPYKGV